MLWTVLVFFTSGWWLFGPFIKWGPLAALPGMAFWLAHGVATVWVFRCPECGCSAFASGKGWFAVYTLWPHKTCHNCGLDLREANVR